MFVLFCMDQPMGRLECFGSVCFINLCTQVRAEAYYGGILECTKVECSGGACQRSMGGKREKTNVGGSLK
jgi:hypothetical protein